MASAQPSSSSSRRPRDTEHREVVIGNFSRLEQIGQGSFATVYKARHIKRGNLVAIKSVILARLNKKLKDNLFSEIHILKELHHPHIVALFDCRETASNIHLVMEYCPMGDLAYFIRKREHFARHPDFAPTFKKYPNPKAGGLHEVMVRHFFQQLASALSFLRDRSLIHRDVKPQNLLINPPRSYYDKPRPDTPYFPKDWSLSPAVGVPSLPTLKLADFGFARSLPKTTLAETLCGSPLYMAPEILRYEKYDAKADLWSVGTVTFEMLTGKPPFRASNHIDLLRNIEMAQDNIKFPAEPRVSREMRGIVGALLKRNPVERISFNDFFDHQVVKGDIPGLVEEDLRQEQQAEGDQPQQEPVKDSPKAEEVELHPAGTTEPKRATSSRETIEEKFHDALDYPSTGLSRRPVMRETATAPPGQTPQVHQRPQTLNTRRSTPPSKPVPNPQGSPRTDVLAQRPTPAQSPRVDRGSEQREVMDAREAREQAAQEVAFERDYVLVEKRAVEVNAFADEMAASPRIQQGTGRRDSNAQGALTRRNTTQTAQSPTTTAGAQVTPSRALQIASGKRPEHIRKDSLERRTRGSSTTSAITKAVALASGRLFNFGLSPPIPLPIGLGSGKVSPPVYNPFPAYPSQGTGLMIGEGTTAGQPVDDDTKALYAIEESAHRSHVVYGFAEVKFKQLIPLAPAVADEGLGLREAGIPSGKEGASASEEDDGLTPDAIVQLSEEALVLYVKSLSLLAHSMDVAHSWWAKKSKGEVTEESSESSPKAPSPALSGTTAIRMNKVVQWVRDRFNEVLEKAEFVRLKLLSAQKRLPRDHPAHPDNQAVTSISSSGAGSTENVHVSPGVSAEKLMYTRALEMGRTAAVNELVCEDLPGCEIGYITAIRMLEAVLDSDDENLPKRLTAQEGGSGSGAAGGGGSTASKADDDALVDAGDREQIVKVVQSFRSRLVALQRKLQVLSERNAAAATATAQIQASQQQPPMKSPISKSPVMTAAQPVTVGSSSPRS